MIIYSPPIKSMVGQDASTIVVRRGDEEIPAIFLNRMGADSPFDKEKVAANLRDLLNGRTPMHGGLFEGKTIQFESLPGAIGLRFRDEGGGVSREGLMISLNYAALPEIIKDLEDKMDADLVVQLCAATMVPAPNSPTSTSRPSLGR